MLTLEARSRASTKEFLLTAQEALRVASIFFCRELARHVLEERVSLQAAAQFLLTEHLYWQRLVQQACKIAATGEQELSFTAMHARFSRASSKWLELFGAEVDYGSKSLEVGIALKKKESLDEEMQELEERICKLASAVKYAQAQLQHHKNLDMVAAIVSTGNVLGAFRKSLEHSEDAKTIEWKACILLEDAVPEYRKELEQKCLEVAWSRELRLRLLQSFSYYRPVIIRIKLDIYYY
ncbi:MAG: hypothetical protein GXO42_00505 [bacterium]|nr:hypothetical protein [bacterium]